MALIPRGFTDILLDRIVDILNQFSYEQSTFDSTVGFTAERDRLRPLTLEILPHINVYVFSDTPDQAGSRKSSNYTAQIFIDLTTKGGNIEFDDEYTEKAFARLNYLKEQVRHCLFRLVNSDFGFPAGTIASKKWPTWSISKAEIEKEEVETIAGRWSLDVLYSWDAEDQSHLALTDITVDSGLWSGIYHYEGE